MLPSKFGYIVTGKSPNNQNVQGKHAHALFVTTEVNPVVSELCLQCCVSSPTASVSTGNKPQLENLWSLEMIGIKDPLSIESDDEALDKFCENIKFEDGRYYITWPWKGDNIHLPDNFGLAFKRMKLLIHRLQFDKELLQNYDAIIKQQLDKGIIEKVDTTMVSDTRKHYLPHHPILTPSKVTTKVRIVYDASARSRDNVNSLNECLHRGPIILPDLCGLLMRFRLYLIVILADIEKAFLQIGIQEFERDVTRFLWLRDVSETDVSKDNLIVYRFCRVPFGLVCSPFLLGATLKFHLQKEGTPLSLNIMDNIYVDNVLIGADNVEEACSIYHEAKEMFKRASMNLREWNSNSDPFLNTLPSGERCVMDIHAVKVLGLLWNKVDDVIYIPNIDEGAINAVITKRDVLHSIAKIFDPLGLITPVTFHGKVFLQRLWKVGQSWDEPLSDDLMKEWNKVAQILIQIPCLKLSRFVRNSRSGVNQLLIFCDASIMCYATTVYLRVLDGTAVETNLVFSRMRLVPTGKGKSKLKKLTIPRLELLAVVIGVRAANFVARELRLNISERILWTDSQCVLHWLKTKKPLSVFVDNRIKEIKQQQNMTFRYITSSHNPADFATRGLTVLELEKSSLWWHGPSWLETNSLSWPTWNLSEITSEEFKYLESEFKGFKSSIEVAHVAGTEKEVLLFGVEKSPCSSLRGLLRISVYVLRFLKLRIWNKLDERKRNLFQHKLLKIIFEDLSNSYITIREIKLVALLWVHTIQHHYYKDVFIALKSNKRNCLQKQLGLQEDEYGILRCYGRYANADISEEMKCPKLLARKNFYTELVILEVHGRLVHAGISHTLSQLRQEYWIPQGRVEVRRVIYQCVICKRHNGPSFCLPNMPPWPKERVSKSNPFTYVGLDYLGPIQVKEGNTVTKMWICLFTCLAVRAIHLELVKGLSAQLFLDCLRRFIARRGKPSLIISDNAPQFRLVKSVLDHQWMNVYRDETVLNFFSYEGIRWQFTIALAPWQGGFYERLVGIVKRSLRKGMGRRLLYWDKLTTLLTEVEAIINTRPLTYIHEEFSSSFILTPAHFLIGGYNNAIPFSTDDIEDTEYLPKVDSSQELLIYWKRNQKQLQLFWRYWTQDYLLNLRETLPLTHKGPKSQVKRQPKIGEIVIIKDDNLPRRAWKLGRIKSYIFSKDNQIRAVKVQLPNKNILDRAINHLYPLEIPSVVNNESEFNVTNNIPVTTDREPLEEPRPVRKAAVEARQKLKDQLQLESTHVIFSFPRGSVMDMEI